MQTEIDILQKENEMLLANGKTATENLHFQRKQTDIYENGNNNLHDKLLTALRKFKNLERELHVTKSQNRNLESQLAEANEQIDKYKGNKEIFSK